MKLPLAFLFFLLVVQAVSQPIRTLQSARNGAPGGELRPTKPLVRETFTLTASADTLIARQFLEAVADTLVSDSMLVARYMCADVLFRKHEPRIDTVVVLMRASLVFLRASLLENIAAVRRSRIIPFKDLSSKLPFELVDSKEGAYVVVEAEEPRLCLLVRGGRVAAFELSIYGEPKKACFRDYCR